jgi:hypothetical protein
MKVITRRSRMTSRPSLMFFCLAPMLLGLSVNHAPAQPDANRAHTSKGSTFAHHVSATENSAPLKIRRGDAKYGDVILTVVDTKVHKGDSKYGDVLMTIDDQKIRRGDSKYGDVLATVDDSKVHKGDSKYGDVIATLDGSKVRKGDSKYGDVIATVEGGNMSGAAGAVFIILM